GGPRHVVRTVVTDGLDGAGLHGRATGGELRGVPRLPVADVVILVDRPAEVVGRQIRAGRARDALAVDVERHAPTSADRAPSDVVAPGVVGTGQSGVPLGPALAAHDAGQGLVHRAALVQHGVHLLGERHRDPLADGELPGRAGRAHALGDLA